jgi:hypothetical protein
MIKLSDILKETYLDRGEQGKVYAIGKDKIKKQSNFLDGFTQDELYFYNQFNKHLDIFPKIYELTKSYVIMDRLYDMPDLSNVLNYLEQINVWRDKDPMTMIYYLLKNNDSSEIDTLLNKTKNNKSVYNSLLKYIKFTQDVLNVFPNKSIDFHTGNIGVDNNGDLKIFDLAI